MSESHSESNPAPQRNKSTGAGTVLSALIGFSALGGVFYCLHTVMGMQTELATLTTQTAHQQTQSVNFHAQLQAQAEDKAALKALQEGVEQLKMTQSANAPAMRWQWMDWYPALQWADQQLKYGKEPSAVLPVLTAVHQSMGEATFTQANEQAIYQALGHDLNQLQALNGLDAKTLNATVKVLETAMTEALSPQQAAASQSAVEQGGDATAQTPAPMTEMAVSPEVKSEDANTSEASQARSLLSPEVEAQLNQLSQEVMGQLRSAWQQSKEELRTVIKIRHEDDVALATALRHQHQSQALMMSRAALIQLKLAFLAGERELYDDASAFLTDMLGMTIETPSESLQAALVTLAQPWQKGQAHLVEVSPILKRTPLMSLLKGDVSTDTVQTQTPSPQNEANVEAAI